MSERSGSERGYRISAVEKAFQVLSAFAAPPHRFTLTELAAASGLSANQAFRVLQTLLAVGFVSVDPESKTYRLGARLFPLIPALFHGDELLLAAGDALDLAVGQTGAMISLIVADGDRATICVDSREPGRAGCGAGGIGSRSTHLHAGAAGKLMLAFGADERIAHYLAANSPLHRFTDKTCATADDLWAEIERIRHDGYAVSLGEVHAEMYGVAAPVRDRRGKFVAAVALAASLVRTESAERERQTAAVIEAARRISTNLGYRAAVAFG